MPNRHVLITAFSAFGFLLLCSILESKSAPSSSHRSASSVESQKSGGNASIRKPMADSQASPIKLPAALAQQAKATLDTGYSYYIWSDVKKMVVPNPGGTAYGELTVHYWQPESQGARRFCLLTKAVMHNSGTQDNIVLTITSFGPKEARHSGDVVAMFISQDRLLSGGLLSIFLVEGTEKGHKDRPISNTLTVQIEIKG